MNLPVAAVLLFVLLSPIQIHAVVNNVKSVTSSESGSNSANGNTNAAPADSVAANTDKEANRREAPIDSIRDSYGVPIPSNSYGPPAETYGPPADTYGPPVDTYVPSAPSNVGLPVPVYGVPVESVKTIVYPVPPPDIPPPLPLPALSSSSLSGAYGSPKPVYGVPLKLQPQGLPNVHYKTQFVKQVFGHSYQNHGPPKSPRPLYGPIAPSFVPKPQYGPPKLNYGPPKLPKPSYGPPLKLKVVAPKPHYGAPKPLYGPPKISSSYGVPIGAFGGSHGNSISSLGLSHGSSINLHGSSGFGGSFGGSLGGSLGGGHGISHGVSLGDSHGGSHGISHGVSFGGSHGGSHGISLGGSHGVSHGGSINLHSSHGGSIAELGTPQSNPVFIPPSTNYKLPKESYGPPKQTYGPPSQHYGPPEPVNHGPPHPGAPAPPTPPDIKYDGWQPILGIVAHPPSAQYEVHHNSGQLSGELSVNGIAPPLLHGNSGPQDLSLTYASSFSHGNSGVVGGISHAHVPSDSYGAPLNSVTGSGGVVSSSAKDHVSFSQGFSSGNFGNILDSIGGANNGHGNSGSVIKSIGYEIFPSGGGGNGNVNIGGHLPSAPIDSYGAPPADSYSADGPYAAAFSYKNKGALFPTTSLSHTSSHSSSFGSSFGSHHGGSSHGLSKGLSISSTGIGLIPPSGMYGVPPGGKYGAPVLSPPKNSYGAPSSSLNALDINPPKSPVVFREPVPSGLLESIGESVAHKDAHGVKHSQTSFQGQAYIPPPVPDITKQKSSGRAHGFSAPTNLYSLPNTRHPVSFHSVAHGPSSGGTGSSSSLHLESGHGSSATLTSYTAPLGAIDSSYGVPLQQQGLVTGFDQSQSIDLSALNFGQSLSSYTVPTISLQSAVGVPHDCSKHGPHAGYVLPSGSASSYAESISSLNTNIGGQSNYLLLPSVQYGSPDLQDVHSLPSNAIQVPTNSLEPEGKSFGHEFANANGGELQKSQEIQIPNGVQNIPIQGALGSYTLQIQSADGLEGIQQGHENIPHDQVLSEGLLQSILAAIEDPQKQQIQQSLIHPDSAHGYGDLQHGPSSSVLSVQPNPSEDGEAQHSVARQVVVSAPMAEPTSTTQKSVIETSSTETSISEPEQSIQLIDNNEIAIYFNNDKSGNVNSQGAKDASIGSDQSLIDAQKEVRNGQQYGSFVSFSAPHSSYVYGELKSANGTQTAAAKPAEN